MKINKCLFKIELTMKFVLLFFIIGMCSCNQNTSQNDLKNQIIDITKQYNKTWESLNVEKIAEFHSDKNFLYWGRGELACKNNNEFRQVFSSIFPMMNKWTVKEISQLSIQVLSEDAVVSSFLLKAESVGKTGKISNHGSGALTYVWNKINGEWKLIHIHESAK